MVRERSRSLDLSVDRAQHCWLVQQCLGIANGIAEPHDPTGRYTYTYDQRGAFARVTAPGEKTIGYTYDAVAHQIQLTRISHRLTTDGPDMAAMAALFRAGRPATYRQYASAAHPEHTGPGSDMWMRTGRVASRAAATRWRGCLAAAVGREQMTTLTTISNPSERDPVRYAG